MRWQGQLKHNIKCGILSLLSMQAIKPDHIMRGWISETKSAIFWVGADGTSVLRRASRPIKGSAGQERTVGDDQGTWKNCIAWLAPTSEIMNRDRPESQQLWSLGRLHMVVAAPRTMGGLWRITLSPASDKFGEMTMLVTDYQGPLISVFSAIRPREVASTSTQPDAPPPRQCSGPVGAILRWTTEPACDAANVFHGLFQDYRDFSSLPGTLDNILDQEQRSVLLGISNSHKAVHVVDALAGTGKSHLARCIIHQWVHKWGSEVDGFLLVALRTRTLRHEFMESMAEAGKDKLLHSSPSVLCVLPVLS
jgi:hypothetical protein